jgi:tRNA threonylcarbamoyladenosine biosynthesis protein TsaE
VLKTWIADTPEALPKVSAEILSATSQTIFLFYGQMGSGKTALIKSICKNLGVTSTITSPTFSIVNTYAGASTVFHFDLYRIKNAQELDDIGFTEYLDVPAYVFIEWPELALPILGAYPVCKINITVLPDNKRSITLEA